MRRTLLLIASLWATSAVGWAGACGSATLAVYESPGFSCSIGDLLFGNFSYINANVPSVPPSDAQIDVSAIVAFPEVGFTFSTTSPNDWIAGPGVTDTYTLDYTVTDAPGFLIHDALLDVGILEADGSTALSEDLGGGPTLSLGSPPVTFAGLSSTDVSTTLTVTGPSPLATGTEQVDNITEEFSSVSSASVPEPASFALLGTALLGVCFLLRRKPGDRSCANSLGNRGRTALRNYSSSGPAHG